VKTYFVTRVLAQTPPRILPVRKDLDVCNPPDLKRLGAKVAAATAWI